MVSNKQYHEFTVREEMEKLIKSTNHKHPLKQAYSHKHRYYDNFVEVMDAFKRNLPERDYKSLIKKFQFNKEFDWQTYLQTVSEINVLYYILRKCNNHFKYEPKYNNGPNPECSFENISMRVNVEVKCSNMDKRIVSEVKNTLKIYSAERVPEHDKIIDDIKKMVEPNLGNTEYDGVEETFRMDNKLKDFLLSAQKKFPTSDDTNFNILVIALDIISDMDEWYSYIFGETGVFTENSFVKESYDRVDAILLTTPVNGHTGWRYCDVDVWRLEETWNVLLLNPLKEHTLVGRYYFDNGIKIFGNYTRLFLRFQQELCERYEKKWKGHMSTPFEMRYADFKRVDLQIFTEFAEYIKNGCSLC